MFQLKCPGDNLAFPRILKVKLHSSGRSPGVPSSETHEIAESGLLTPRYYRQPPQDAFIEIGLPFLSKHTEIQSSPLSASPRLRGRILFSTNGIRNSGSSTSHQIEDCLVVVAYVQAERMRSCVSQLFEAELECHLKRRRQHPLNVKRLRQNVEYLAGLVEEVWKGHELGLRHVHRG